MRFSTAFLPCCLFSIVLAMPSGWAAAPAVPRGLAMVANSADSITLAWYRPVADDAKSYHVYASDKSDGTFKRIATVTERTATHGKLTAGTSYFYKVSAANADGESEPSKPVPAFTITPSKGAEFPVKIAKNMCVSLGATVISSPAPIAGKLTDLVDGSDATLEPAKDNIFYNTLAADLAGVDVFCRTRAPYACDPATQLPYADYWTYMRKNYATALAKDGVHHTKAGSDGINQLWASVADRMIYSRQK